MLSTGNKIARFLLGLLAILIASVLLALGLFLLVSGGNCSPGSAFFNESLPASGEINGSGNDAAGGRGLIQPENIVSLALPAIFGIAPDVNSSQAEDGTQQAVNVQEDVPVPIKIEIEKLSSEVAQAVAPIQPTGEGPLVLIYHSHTHEAYRQEGDYTYVEVGSWRTGEQDKSVVAVGELLAQELSQKYGIPVLHDTTDHERNDYNNSYPQSLKTIQKDMMQYPGIKVLIDLHRDAYTGESGKNDFVMVNGNKAAKVMFVVGTGEGKTGNGFDIKPDWKENYKFASAVTEELKKSAPDLIKPIRVKTGRYNMHMSKRTLVVEVGHNMNTLEEAKNAIPCLAEAIASVMLEGSIT